MSKSGIIRALSLSWTSGGLIGHCESNTSPLKLVLLEVWYLAHQTAGRALCSNSDSRTGLCGKLQLSGYQCEWRKSCHARKITTRNLKTLQIYLLKKIPLMFLRYVSQYPEHCKKRSLVSSSKDLCRGSRTGVTAHGWHPHNQRPPDCRHEWLSHRWLRTRL